MGATSIYLDHNATTPPHPEVVDTVARVSMEAFANPGSRHSGGRAARRVLEQSRELIADVLGAAAGEVMFTSGGTEANNLAISGFARGRRGAFAALAGEHPSVEGPLQQLEGEGWRRCVVPMSMDGLVEEEGAGNACHTLSRVCHPEVDLQFGAVLLAHNETGVIRDVAPWAEFCRERRIPLHVDAVQAAARIEVNFAASGATTMAVAAHKFRGPRGIGGLLIRTGSRLPAAMFGGHQENGVRPGTECVALAAGMAMALELWRNERVELAARLMRLRDQFEAGVLAAVSGAFVHATGAPRLPNTSNIAFPGCEGDALFVALDLAGVCASLGSACASGSSEPAPILLAMGCSPEVARSSIRFSIGWTNSEDEITEAIGRIRRVVDALRA
jgi:cysteine desulfurase